MPVRRRATAASVCTLVALIALLGPGAESGRAATPEFVSNELIVRFRANDAAVRASVLADIGGAIDEKLSVPNAYVVRLKPGLSPPAAAAILARRLDVAYAHPNYYARANTIPDDERYQQLWNLNQASDKDIDAPEAWDLTTGSSAVVVAVVDSGVAWDHPDLFPNTWANPYEVVNSRDEDRNGMIDDVRGWDWTSEDNNPSDENGHGTHVAGTIGAKGNNAYGVVGVNWDVSIMHLRVLNEDGYGTFEDVADAFDYAGENKARVVNASLSCYACPEPTVVRDAIARHPNTLYVVASGNESSSNDAKSSYPCNHKLANLICVAATTPDDTLAGFSNYGTDVDLAAPGVGITSTWLAYDDRFVDGFENGIANWVTGGSNNSWAAAAAPAGSKGSSATDSPAGNYQNNTNSYLRLAQPLSFAGKRGCQARYSMLLAAELGWDFVWVEGSTGGAWTGLDGWTIPTGGAFVDLETSMKDFDYEPEVHFRFRFQSDDEVVADGVYVDDVRLRCRGTSYNADDFDTVSGTSMASPQVTGVAALAFARRPLASAAAVKAAILSSVDPIASLQGKVATGGRLNAQNAVAAIDRLAQAPPPPPPPSGRPPPPSASPRTAQSVCRVPKVVGNRLAKARKRITAGGCRVGKIQRAKSRYPGRVIRQRPAAGARRARGTTVVLTVGRR